MRACLPQRARWPVAWQPAYILRAITLTPSFRRRSKRRPGQVSRRRARSWRIKAARLQNRRRDLRRLRATRRTRAASPISNQPLLLASPFAFLDRRALVVLLLAFREADVELHPPSAVMQVERHERVARALDLSDETADLAFVQEQHARTRGIGVHVRRRRREGRDVRADQL